ncbi:MAG: DUF2809 domain-containing protein [Alphaproteobacteria bacterium]|nr:DUF2809 domain-containing protein [Alphaproteobacteria bacterium]
MRRALPALVAALSLLGGLGLFRFGTGFVRGFGGDVLIVVLLVSLLATPRVGTARLRLLAVGLFAVGTECFQALHLVGPDSHWLLHLTIGSTFDPLDLLAYGVGLVVAAGLERAWRLSPPPSP